MPTNFKTYETQARLLAAVVAAHPELKLNYKAIALHYGSDVTESAVEHRFRPVKGQSKALRAAVAKSIDPKTVNVLDKAEIARVFGGSTPDGVSFQFRAIKKDANALLKAANDGVQPSLLSKGPNTPRKPRGSGKAKGTPGSAATTDGASTTGSRKRRTNAAPSYQEVGSTNEDESPVDYDELDVTPIPKKVRTGDRKMTSLEFDESAAFQFPLVAGAIPFNVHGAAADRTTPLAHVPTQEEAPEATPSLTDHSALTSPVLKFESDVDMGLEPAAVTTGPAHPDTSYVSLFGPGPSAPPEPAAALATPSYSDSFFDGDGGYERQNTTQETQAGYHQSFDDGEI